MSLMQAKFVYDGVNEPPVIPSDMGTPKETQFLGTPREQTAELCGRICYDSLGKGRGSDEYHQHIHEVGHLSVYEHTPITVIFRSQSMVSDDVSVFLLSCLNRPGVFVRLSSGGHIRITANFRAILEWDNRVNNTHPGHQKIEREIGNSLKVHANDVAPMCVPVTENTSLLSSNRVEPEHEHEKWVTLLMCGSRGFSHEQVRHGDNTAISQRSTRYVDESGSPWVEHPLLTMFHEEQANSLRERYKNDGDAEGVVQRARLDSWDDRDRTNIRLIAGEIYDATVTALQPWLIARGVDKLTARKQARGAARGFLGNALHTEMMFSASVGQWLWMIKQRGSQFADAEIREVYSRENESVLSSLRQSRFAESFSHLEIVESSDGIGTVVQEKG